MSRRQQDETGIDPSLVQGDRDVADVSTGKLVDHDEDVVVRRLAQTQRHVAIGCDVDGRVRGPQRLGNLGSQSHIAVGNEYMHVAASAVRVDALSNYRA
jgi:hypothetical protein